MNRFLSIAASLAFLTTMASILVSCGVIGGITGDKDKNSYESKFKDFRQAETNLVTLGCTIDEKDANTIVLDCSHVHTDSMTSSGSSRLSEYVSKGRELLDESALMNNRFLDTDARLRIERKINLANQVRGRLRK